MVELKGNAVVAQSGGPTGVINASVVGVVEEAKKHPEIQGIYGALNAVEGALEQIFINLQEESQENLHLVSETSGSGLGSSRKKPKDEHCDRLLKVFKAHNIRYFFYIGGNDSANTANIINTFAEQDQPRYEFRAFHIPKTVDNDLLVSDHCPGYGTAATYIALEFMGITNDQYSLPGIHILKVMGRKAGFLTAASVLGKRDERDAPHLVYIPEVTFSVDDFVEDVLATYEKYGTCVVALSEGVKTEDGKELITLASEKLYGTSELLPRDDHGNIQLSGLGGDLDYLLAKINEASPNARVRTDRLTYNQRSHPTIISYRDRTEAYAVGKEAVTQAVNSDIGSGSIAIRRIGYGRDYGIELFVTDLQNVAEKTRSMPAEFYDGEKKMPTDAFIKYACDLIGPLPAQGRLEKHFIEKKPI